MDALNRTVFLFINAPDHPAARIVFLARLFGEYCIWLVPLLIGLGWLRGNEWQRKAMLEATVAGLVGLMLNVLISSAWQHPRPFMIGLGHTLIPHAADSSFPSDHLTLLWAVAFSLLTHARVRAPGLALALIGLPMAWARIYLGVHFPLDMVGAIAVAAVSARLAMGCRLGLVWPAYAALMPVHRKLFGPLIRRGWLQE